MVTFKIRCHHTLRNLSLNIFGFYVSKWLQIGPDYGTKRLYSDDIFVSYEYLPEGNSNI